MDTGEQSACRQMQSMYSVFSRLTLAFRNYVGMLVEWYSRVERLCNALSKIESNGIK